MLDPTLCPNHPPDAYPWPVATTIFGARRYCRACADFLAGRPPTPSTPGVVSTWRVVDRAQRGGMFAPRVERVS